MIHIERVDLIDQHGNRVIVTPLAEHPWSIDQLADVIRRLDRGEQA